MIILRSLSALLAFSLLATGCASRSPDTLTPLSGHVAGTVTYQERVALPPDARVIVSLEDISQRGKKGTFVAQQTLQPRTQVPIAYDLRYVPQSIDRSHEYTVQAVIIDSTEELLWASTESYPVLFNEPEKPVAITLQRVIHPAATALPPANSGKAFKCDDLAFIVKFGTDNAQIMLAARTLTLPHVVSASGLRYTDGSSTFWDQGEHALLELNGVSYTGCKNDPLPPPAAPK